MFFAVFFGIILAVLFLASLPFTLPLFGAGAIKIIDTAAKKVDKVNEQRAIAAQIQAERDRGSNPLLWSWRKTLLFSLFILIIGVGGILLGVWLGIID